VDVVMDDNKLVLEAEMDTPDDWEDVEYVQDANGNIKSVKGGD
jgi:hypothetical protein